MSGDYLDPETGEVVPRPRDPQIDAAKAILMEQLFTRDSEEVYYGRQVEIMLEGQFFHWITKKALNELRQEGRIVQSEETTSQFTAHFYHHPRYRFPRRKINAMVALISEYSAPDFGHALGHVGETLADTAFATVGFRIRGREIQEVDGQRWTQTGHDLDRLIERDGIRYGVEVKNQLGYIDRDEFDAKLAMCQFLGIRPFFIVRAMPKSYIYEVVQRNGFVLVLNNQHYPLLANDLMVRVRNQLQLPVAMIRSLPDTALNRFEAWHQNQLPAV